MKLIPWECFDEIEAYTTCAYDDFHNIMDMSFHNENNQKVLCKYHVHSYCHLSKTITY